MPKNSVSGNNSGNSRNGSYPKKIQTEHGEAIIPIPRDRNGQFEPIVVPKHESRGLSIEKLVISLYAKGMSVSDIEKEMREIYEIELSTSAISVITNKVNQAAQEWQNRPLDPVYLIVWMDGIIFKVRDNGKIINKTVYLCVGPVSYTHLGPRIILQASNKKLYKSCAPVSSLFIVFFAI